MFCKSNYVFDTALEFKKNISRHNLNSQFTELLQNEVYDATQNFFYVEIVLKIPQIDLSHNYYSRCYRRELIDDKHDSVDIFRPILALRQTKIYPPTSYAKYLKYKQDLFHEALHPGFEFEPEIAHIIPISNVLLDGYYKGINGPLIPQPARIACVLGRVSVPDDHDPKSLRPTFRNLAQQILDLLKQFEKVTDRGQRIPVIEIAFRYDYLEPLCRECQALVGCLVALERIGTIKINHNDIHIHTNRGGNNKNKRRFYCTFEFIETPLIPLTTLDVDLLINQAPFTAIPTKPNCKNCHGILKCL